MLNLNGLSRLDDNIFLNQSILLQAAGIDTDPTKDLELPDLRDLLLSRQKEVEALKPRLSGAIENNVRLLADCLSLSQVDAEILAFTVSLRVCEPLADVTNILGELDAARVFSALSVILGLPVVQVNEALSSEGTLTSSGLVQLHGPGCFTLQHKLAVLVGLSDGRFEA